MKTSFGHFHFQQKQMQWHFYKKKKNPKFLAHTLSLCLYLHSPMILSLSLSPLWSQNQKPHHQFLSLYSTRIFSLSLIGLFALSLSLSRLSSTMFCFVLFLFLFFFFYSTRLIRFGGGKSKLWL